MSAIFFEKNENIFLLQKRLTASNLQFHSARLLLSFAERSALANEKIDN